MKTPWLLKTYSIGILIILFGVTVHAPLSVWFGSLLPDYALAIKAWKELLLVLLLGVAIILVTQRSMWRQLLRDRLMQLIVAYAVLHVIFAPFSGQGWSSVIAGLMIDLRFVLYFVLCLVLVKLQPGALRSLMQTFFAGAVVVIGFGLLQISILPDDVLSHIGYSKQTISAFTTIDNNPDFVRINSTLRGPNPLGAYCLIIGSLLMAYLLRKRRQLSYQKKTALLSATALTGVVAFASYSRSAYLAAIVSLVAIIAGLGKIRWSPKIVGVSIAAVLVTVVGFLSVQSSDWYHNVVLHEDPESSVITKSNSEHLRSLTTNSQRVLTQPVGSGIGSTGSASLYDDKKSGMIVENAYLFIMHETGWLGIILFLAIVGMIQLRLWQRRQKWIALGLFASGLGLAVIGLLLPVWADETVAFVWWGLAGAILGSTYEQRTRQ